MAFRSLRRVDPGQSRLYQQDRGFPSKEAGEVSGHMEISKASASDLLKIDPQQETDRMVEGIRDVVFNQLRRRGAVLGVSGGIDSTVVAYLCAQALGKDRVQVLFMPEVDSSSDSLRLGTLVADLLGVRHVTEDIAPALAGARLLTTTYAVRLSVPESARLQFKTFCLGLAAAAYHSFRDCCSSSER